MKSKFKIGDKVKHNDMINNIGTVISNLGNEFYIISWDNNDLNYGICNSSYYVHSASVLQINNLNSIW